MTRLGTNDESVVHDRRFIGGIAFEDGSAFGRVGAEGRVAAVVGRAGALGFLVGEVDPVDH